MGSMGFYSRYSAKTATEAFRVLQDIARESDGDDIYSGTIAQKETFEMVLPLPGESAKSCKRRYWEDEKHWCHDDWGPAACIDVGPNPKKPGLRIFYFFGEAPW